jgi:cytochrome P450
MLPIEKDDPIHQFMRKPLNIALSPKAVSNLSPAIRALTIEIIDQLKPRGECDFVQDFSLRVPMEVFLRLVKLPLSDQKYLIGLAHDGIKNPDIARRHEASVELFQYIGKWIHDRSEHPGDDLLSAIVNMDVDGRPLTDQEKLGYVATTLFGGLDTVATTISMIVKHLAKSAVDRRHLAAHPKEIANAIEELLRRFSIPTVGRTLTRDAMIGGVRMKKGDRVMLPTMLHGLDERRWPDAMTVKLDRCPKDHMAFGKGTHRCPGANLARLELRIFLEEWLARIPEFSVQAGSTIRYESGPVAGIASLPLVWTVARLV